MPYYHPKSESVAQSERSGFYFNQAPLPKLGASSHKDFTYISRMHNQSSVKSFESKSISKKENAMELVCHFTKKFQEACGEIGIEIEQAKFEMAQRLWSHDVDYRFATPSRIEQEIPTNFKNLENRQTTTQSKTVKSFDLPALDEDFFESPDVSETENQHHKGTEKQSSKQENTKTDFHEKIIKFADLTPLEIIKNTENQDHQNNESHSSIQKNSKTEAAEGILKRQKFHESITLQEKSDRVGKIGSSHLMCELTNQGSSKLGLNGLKSNHLNYELSASLEASVDRDNLKTSISNKQNQKLEVVINRSKISTSSFIKRILLQKKKELAIMERNLDEIEMRKIRF